MDTSGDAPIFVFTKNQDGIGSLLAIVPKGESDRGLPPGSPTTLTATLSNKNAQIQEWQLSDGKILKIYNFLDQIQNWEKCESDLKNCNRIELQADSANDMDTLEEMLETFRFTK